MQCDSNNNVYVVGEFRYVASEGTIDLNPDAGTDAVTGIDNKYTQFISKYNSAGTYQWSKLFTNNYTSTRASIEDVGIDSDNNIYITGYFSDTIDMDPSGSTATLTASGSADIVFAKYDSDGNYLWAHNIGASGSDIEYPLDLTIHNDHLYFAGFFNTTDMDFDPSGNVANLSDTENNGAGFVAEYDENGNYVWAYQFNGSDYDEAYSVEVSDEGEIYVTGEFDSPTLDFDTSSNDDIKINEGSADAFIAKFDSRIFPWSVIIYYQ